MDKKTFELLKKIFTITDDLDKYVILCEDEQGRYIKYAFKDGEPHDNRCLSWYDKLQPEALKRNGHDVDEWKKTLHKVGEIYRLHMMCCGNENLKGIGHCSPGHPKKGCSKCWTYEEPVKCACWLLEEVDFYSTSFKLKMTFKQIKELEKLLKQ